MHICGEGNGSPLQYSSLENHMDRGAWWAAVHGVTKSRTWLKWLSSSSACIVSITSHLSGFDGNVIKWQFAKERSRDQGIVKCYHLKGWGEAVGTGTGDRKSCVERANSRELPHSLEGYSQSLASLPFLFSFQCFPVVEHNRKPELRIPTMQPLLVHLPGLE